MTAGTCTTCGYGKQVVNGKELDPNWWRCYEFGCSDPGGLSDRTTGGGHFYCAKHYKA